MSVEEGVKTHGRWRNALCEAGVTQQHGEATRASPGMSSGTQVGGNVRPPLPSRIPGMCQQLRALPHAPGERCGAACWNLLLLGGVWAEESWHRAGGTGRGGRALVGALM